MKRGLCLLAAMAAFAAPAAAAAQGPRTAAAVPTAGPLQDQNQDQPIQIEAATLEVHDKNKMATFSGDVQVVQGDTTIKCQSLVVFYGAGHVAGGTGAGDSGATSPGGRPPQGPRLQQTPAVPQGAADIRRIEARGDVTVISKDQNASGDLGVYDLKKKTITLTGNVVVSQGKNVLHGDRVVVDTTTGNAHFDSGAGSQNRVRALILPSKSENGGPPNIMSIAPNRPN
jgi:lipopolysaccharide export system protein LptA